MKHLYIVAILGCLLLSVSAGAEEIPVVQLDPEGNELFQPNWPEPCMDGETVEDPFCDESGGSGGEGGGGDCSTCQYCGAELINGQIVPTCKQTAFEDPRNTCFDDSSGTSCIASGPTCWRI